MREKDKGLLAAITEAISGSHEDIMRDMKNIANDHDHDLLTSPSHSKGKTGRVYNLDVIHSDKNASEDECNQKVDAIVSGVQAKYPDLTLKSRQTLSHDSSGRYLMGAAANDKRASRLKFFKPS